MSIPNPKWAAEGKQIILKSDFLAIEQAIVGQPQVRLIPPLLWLDVATVRVEANAGCPVGMQFTGLPNILNSGTQIHGGLSDNKIRTNTGNVSAIFGAGGLWGAEKASQWYAILALAGDEDTTFTLKAMPWIRVKSQAGQIISFGTNLDASVNLGYGFTANEFIGGMVYVITGASRGLLRPVTANSNGATSPGTVTYSGTALSLAQGDFFIILPPTNFRWLGDVWNDAAGDFLAAERFLAPEFPLVITSTRPVILPQGKVSGYLTISAGGGGPNNADDGGGGQFYYRYPLSGLTPIVFLAVVGLGGAWGNPTGSDGGDSSFAGLTADGGGGASGGPGSPDYTNPFEDYGYYYGKPGIHVGPGGYEGGPGIIIIE